MPWVDVWVKLGYHADNNLYKALGHREAYKLKGIEGLEGEILSHRSYPFPSKESASEFVDLLSSLGIDGLCCWEEDV